MESVIPRGVRNVPRAQLAYACNERSMGEFTTRAATLGRKKLKNVNGKSLATFTTMAEVNLKRLEPIKANAQKLLEGVEQRKESGELDDLTAYSESVGPQIVLELSEFLTQVYSKARSAKDAFALSRVFAMTGSLEAASRELLMTQTYGTTDPTAFGTLVETSVYMAQGVHANVVDGLFECPGELGVIPPVFPELPKTLQPPQRPSVH